jgi:ubiquinone/menaquinone biosynthesis C-methylase UbiE
MMLAAESYDISCHESEVYQRLLSLDNKHILELGCGRAEKTRDIASTGVNRTITATEVDVAAHAKNLRITDLPNVRFILSGAQDIPLADESVDIVMMFKSLHHVPEEFMQASLGEIWRVLRPDGQAYISEPVFAGEFNEILRLFNDEQAVRESAFKALKQSVDNGMFRLVEEVFFNTPGYYRDFAEFEHRIINATHSQYVLDAALYRRVKHLFEQYMQADGAHFVNPQRVDLLQKPA